MEEGSYTPPFSPRLDGKGLHFAYPGIAIQANGDMEPAPGQIEDDGMNAELLLLLVSIAESLVVLPPISLLLTNIIPVDLVEGFIEGLIDRDKVAERYSFTYKSYLYTVAA